MSFDSSFVTLYSYLNFSSSLKFDFLTFPIDQIYDEKGSETMRLCEKGDVTVKGDRD